MLAKYNPRTMSQKSRIAVQLHDKLCKFRPEECCTSRAAVRKCTATNDGRKNRIVASCSSVRGFMTGGVGRGAVFSEIFAFFYWTTDRLTCQNVESLDFLSTSLQVLFDPAVFFLCHQAVVPLLVRYSNLSEPADFVLPASSFCERKLVQSG